MNTLSNDVKELIALGLNAERLSAHADHDISMALCAIQESGNDIELIKQLGDQGAARLYAESALGW